jgi:hypothetical protein
MIRKVVNMKTKPAFFLLLLLSAAALSAQTHPNGITFGIGNSSSDIAVRHLFGNEWAALGTLGYSHGAIIAVDTNGGTHPLTAWSLGLTARRYIRPGDLRPFAEAGGGLRWSGNEGICSGVHSPFATAGGGVEYKVASQVSIEGSAGLSYSSFSQRCEFGGVVTHNHQNSLSTFRSALSLTFYF